MTEKQKEMIADTEKHVGKTAADLIRKSIEEYDSLTPEQKKEYDRVTKGMFHKMNS
jgi:hypothetical protein